MIPLEGYRITEVIYSDMHSVMYRGVRESDHTPVIIKTHAGKYPDTAEIDKYSHDFEIGQKISDDHVAEYMDLLPLGNGKALIEKDFKATTLAAYMRSIQLKPKELLIIARQLASGLGAIHRSNTVHRNIEPANILINPETLETKISNFSLATRVSREIHYLTSPDRIQGALSYISPEQTGRVNRSLDYRTDFYSLGVVLYEAATRQLPFAEKDPMQLVHAHIAKQPDAPHKIYDGIPEPVSRIIMKLMSKLAEDRYQSARGLRLDLETCRRQMTETGQVKIFTLGQQDVSEKFTIPEKLYGREAEVNILQEAFGRAAGGQKELLLVSGEPGVGKSVLVNEINRHVALKKGCFISGKYDQLHKHLAYSALVQAFQSLIRQILGEDAAQIARWKEQLLAALGPNGQVMIQVIPDLALIIGSQPWVADLGPVETQNRFHWTFLNFLKVFAGASHPLVIFLDDLQWADLASLNLIKRIALDEEGCHLLLIGAYRDNEVGASHPAAITFNEIQKAGPSVRNVTLAPLDMTRATRLIADTLICRAGQAGPLAERVHKKTGGNPFFLKSFLRSLYDEGLVSFVRPEASGATARGWRWDMDEINRLQVTANVADLLVSRIQQQSETSVEILKMAACLGNSFRAETLSMLTREPLDKTLSLLEPGLNDGMLFELNDRYYFVHDRVQEAAYSMVPEAERPAAHLRIGRVLLERYDLEEQEETALDALSQMNAGRELIDDAEEKIKLAELNLMASQQAKESAAYDLARKYLAAGTTLLPEDGWQRYYELTFSLYSAQAEAEFLSGNFEKASALYDLLLDNARTDLERVHIYVLQINQLSFESEYLQAIDIGRNALKLMGLDFPLIDEHLMPRVEGLIEEIFKDLEKIKAASLADLPEAQDPVIRARMEILFALLPLAYYVDPGLLAYCAGSIVSLSIKRGNCPTSPAGYSFFAVLLVSLESYELGHELGAISLSLAEKYQIGPQMAMACHMFSACINHWKQPLKTNLAFAQQGYEVGVESGDLQWSSYTRVPLAITHLYMGTPLKAFLEIIKSGHAVGEKFKNQIVPQVLLPMMQFARNLRGETRARDSFDTDAFSESQFLEDAQAIALMSISWFHGLKLRLGYLYGDYRGALAHAAKAEEFLHLCSGLLIIIDVCFYRALARLALYPDLPEEEKARHWEAIQTDQARLKLFAGNCPENFEAQSLLVDAEALRVQGEMTAAMDLYEAAIEAARQQENLPNEALAHELYARFWLAWGRIRIAGVYMDAARYLYARWGTARKNRHLEETYGEVLSKAAEVRGPQGAITLQTSPDLPRTKGAESLDLMTVIKASQAISSEISLKDLLARMIKIIVESAGAQKGFLIQKQENKAMIQAAAATAPETAEILKLVPVDEAGSLCRPIVNYVLRAGQSVILHHADLTGDYADDPYIRENEIKSVLCTPFQYQDKLYGVLYLENNLVPGAFTDERIQLLQVLLAQAAISLENAELFDRNLFFQRFVEESSQGFGWADIEGRIRYANTTLARILGAPVRENIYGQPLFNFYSRQSQQQLRDEILPIVLDRGLWTGELTLHGAKGEQTPTQNSIFLIRDAQQEPLYLANVLTDITERKRSEKALLESEGRFRSLVETTSDWIWEVDASGTYTYVSPKVKDLLGYDPEELIGETLFDLMPPAEKNRVEMIFADLVAGLKPIEHMENTVIHKDGREVILETSGVPVFDVEGAFRGYRGIDRDITDRRQFEAHLGQAQKMEALGTLAGGIAHDFNNILSAIIGFTELSLLKGPADKDICDYLEQALQSCKRARKLTGQMLSFSRQTDQQKEAVQVSEIVEEVLSFLRASLPTTIDIDKNIQDGLGSILADPTQVHQIVMNICTNAAHAMRQTGGVLKIALSEEDLGTDDVLPRSGLAPGPYIKLTIGDTGHGMEKRVLDRIFDPFFTTKQPGEGTGMGLFVVHGIVKNHGGFISAQSQPDQGTTFEILFPRHADPAAAAPRAAERIERGSGHILFVDDEQALAAIAGQSLKFLGYEVSVFKHALDALKAFRQAPERYDLIITDMTMPEMTGTELARQILKIRARMPIILCTGFNENLTPEEIREIGIRELLMKPAPLPKMSRAIKRVLTADPE